MRGGWAFAILESRGELGTPSWPPLASGQCPLSTYMLPALLCLAGGTCHLVALWVSAQKLFLDVGWTVPSELQAGLRPHLQQATSLML